MAEVETTVESGIHELSAVAIIDGQERPTDTQLRVARGLRSDPPTDLFVLAGSATGRGTQAGQLIGAVIENELRRSPGRVARYLRRAIEAAHLRLQEKAERSPNLDWTASIGCVLINDTELIFAGVGQTAAFLLRAGQLELIEDSSADGRPWLDSRLGAADEPQVNMCGGRLEPGDRVLVVVGHLPPHLSGTRLRYQLQSSPDAIIQELRSAVTPEDCLAAIAFSWEPVRRLAPDPRPSVREPEAEDLAEPVHLPVGAYGEREEAPVYDVAVGAGRMPSRRQPERPARPRAQVASASIGGPWRPAGVAGGRARPAADAPRRTAGRRPAGRPQSDEGGTPGVAQLGLLAARRIFREFLPDNQAGLATGFVQTTWRTGTAARQSVGPLGRRWVIGAAIGLVVLLAVGFFAFRTGFSRQDPRQELATALGKAEAARSAAVAAPDRDTARKQLATASDAVKAALAIMPNDAQALSLQEDIQKDFKRLNGVLALGKVSPLADLTAQAGTAANATGILYQNGRAYVVDGGSGKVFRMVVVSSADGLKVEEKPGILFQLDDAINDIKLGSPISILWATADNGRPTNNLLVMDAFRNLYQFNSVTERVKVPVRGAADWKSFKQAVSYQGNLYVLDTEGDQVWRYYPAAGGYDSEMKPMLESAELSDVAQFAVDGDIYLLTTTGKIRKYVGGAAVDFKMTGLDTPIGKGASLHTGRDTKSIYVADPANGRVVVFDKNGSFKWQLVDERFKNVSTLTVDEKGKTLMFVAANQVYTAPLPAELASTG